MNWLRWVGVGAVGLLWLAVGTGYSHAADGEEKPGKTETVVIPLDQIWGYEIPGSRPLKYGRLSSTGEHISDESPIVEDIMHSVDIIEHGRPADPSFVVEGKGIDAIHNAHAVCTKKRKASKVFNSEKELSAFFFSHTAGRYVRIIGIARHDKEIVIQYRFEPHIDAGLTTHFALIPIGKLSPGEYEIKIILRPMESQFQNIGVFPLPQQDIDRVACKSSKFTVQSTPTPANKRKKRCSIILCV